MINSIQKLFVGLIICNIFLFSLSACSKEKIMYAGISKKNITPNSKQLLGNKTVHDTLYAKTIILDNEQDKVAFIIVDSQGIAQFVIDEAKKKIHQETSFPIENIVIASTHTHSGIIANTSPHNFKNSKLTDYQIFLVNALTEGFSSAYNNQQPVQIAWGKFDKPEHVFNRRWYTEKLNVSPLGTMDSVKMNPGSALRDQLIKPAGPTDPEVNFIAIKTLDNMPLAILANYSLHYVGGIEKDALSADYFGVFDIEVNKLLNQNKLNPNFVSIMSNGTSGDVNNNDYSKPLPTYPNYEKMTLVAKDLAENLAQAYHQLQFQNWVSIKVLSESISLEKRTKDVQLNNNLKKITNNKLDKRVFHKNEKYYATRTNNYEKTYPNSFDVPLQVIQLGNLSINTIPFEVFAETGLELKEKSSFDNSFTIGLANGHWGYLPTPEQHKKGGYETWITINRVEKNSSRIITDKILDMQQKIKKQNR